MSTILIRDTLRQSVEAASGGEQTVIYTAKGQPCFMNIVRKYDLSTIDSSLSGTHPAFIVGGVEKDAILIGTYSAFMRDGEMLSLPNVRPIINVGHDNFIAAARANGAGFHMITNAEWSAVSLQCFKQTINPFGNNLMGRSIENQSLVGRRVDGKPIGSTVTVEADGITLTGSGPANWRHNLKYNGISDIAGNVNELCAGFRVVNGEIQIIENNNAALATTNFAADSLDWKAIHAETGALIATNSAMSVKIAIGGSVDYSITMTNAGLFSQITNPSSKPVLKPALDKLKALTIFPLVQNGNYGADIVYIRSGAEQMLSRGGRWTDGSNAGIHAINLFDGRAVGGTSVPSTRLAYYSV